MALKAVNPTGTNVTVGAFADNLIVRASMMASLIRAIDKADNDADSATGSDASDRTNLIILARDYANETERLAIAGWEA